MRRAVLAMLAVIAVGLVTTAGQSSLECLITVNLSDDAVYVWVSPDGKTVASRSHDDETIMVWDAATGTLLHTLAGHIGWINTVAFSPDGRAIASGSAEGTINLWDAGTGTLLRSLAHEGAVFSAAFSPDGSMVASGGASGMVKLWDTATGTLLRALGGHTNSVSSVAFSPDGRTIASGSNDMTIKLWDTATGRCLHTLVGQTNWCTSVAFSPEGGSIAAGSVDGTIMVWNAMTGTRTSAPHTLAVSAIAFSPDGRTVASGSSDMTIKLWDTATGACLCTIVGHTGVVSSVVFSPNGESLTSGSADGTVKVWDVRPALAREPDIVVRVFTPTPPVPATIEQNASFEITVVNQGTATAGAFLVSLSGPVSSVNKTVPPLEPGASETLYLSLRISGSGDTFTAMADAAGQVAESDETNNSLSQVVRAISLAAPSSTPSATYTPPAAGSTYEITSMRWSVAGYGEGQQTTTVRVEVEVKNVGSRATSNTTIWVGAMQFGDPCSGYGATWDQEESNSVSLRPGRTVTWSVYLMCPTGTWAQIAVRVSDSQGGSACRMGNDFYI